VVACLFGTLSLKQKFRATFGLNKVSEMPRTHIRLTSYGGVEHSPG